MRRQRKANIPQESATIIKKNKYRKSAPRNNTCGTCALCGKPVLAVSGDPRPYPASWPEELQIYQCPGSGKDIAHRICLHRIQKLRTEFLSGAITERWSQSPPLGSPRSMQIKYQRQRREAKKSKPFSSTVRLPTQTSLGTTVSRPSDSLHTKSKIRVPTPPSMVPSFPLLAAASRKNPTMGSGTKPQLQVDSSRGRKIRVRVLFN
jgi:hypothetical protein